MIGAEDARERDFRTGSRRPAGGTAGEPAGAGRRRARLVDYQRPARRAHLPARGAAPPGASRQARASLLALSRLGATPAAGFVSAAIHYPHEPAVSDELGTLSFEQVHRRTNALARALFDAGIGPGDGVAIMCRGHRGFVEATVAGSKLGANARYL